MKNDKYPDLWVQDKIEFVSSPGKMTQPKWLKITKGIVVGLYCALVAVVVMHAACAAFQPGDISTAQKCLDIVGSYQRGIENAAEAKDAERLTAEVADFFKTWNEQGCQELVERVAEETQDVAQDTP